jgi:hypothetical protein
MHKHARNLHPILSVIPDDDTTIIMNGLDDALLGASFLDDRYHAVYSVEWVIKSLMKTNKWNKDEATDFAYYNVIQNIHYGQMPIFVDTMPNIRRTK